MATRKIIRGLLAVHEWNHKSILGLTFWTRLYIRVVLFVTRTGAPQVNPGDSKRAWPLNVFGFAYLQHRLNSFMRVWSSTGFPDVVSFSTREAILSHWPTSSFSSGAAMMGPPAQLPVMRRVICTGGGGNYCEDHGFLNGNWSHKIGFKEHFQELWNFLYFCNKQ